jgi:uncharacterized membrane protein (UPF0127 family)
MTLLLRLLRTFGRIACVGIAGTILVAAIPAKAADSGTEPLTIATSTGVHEFAVEVMRTPPELEKGLMFRRFLPANRGMLFDFKIEQAVMMWMTNTYIPLDMIFIGKSGHVVSIAADTKPLSEHIITSGASVLAVLEVNAGTAAKIGLKIGDKVNHPLFGP